MILYRILSGECSICLIVKEMTRRILADYPEITAEDVDVDLEPERAKTLVLPEEFAKGIHPGIPIPYLRLGDRGLYCPRKMQEIRDFLDETMATAMKKEKEKNGTADS